MRTSDQPAPLDRHSFDTAALMADHAPRVHNPNKQVVLDIACPPGAVHGTLGYSRWAAMELPEHFDPVPPDLVLSVPGFFDYQPVLDGDDVVEWHVNFADPHLFVAYAGGLFAQDEMQVAEHPGLAALKQALVAADVETRTDGHAGPTPVLVTGVERRVAIETNPDSVAGRPHGLYGNAFAAADADAVRRATTPIDPPTVTNLIAIAAIAGGWGHYTRDEIHRTLVTSYTGFRAAGLESERLPRGPARVVVHSGYWGCGAFGGNRVLMALLQIVATQMAGLERLVFHTGSPGGDTPLTTARSLLVELSGAEAIKTADLLAAIVAHGFDWGVGDGN
jgi:Poly (ADP-ribose) glycohydrolase (PARG)